MKVQFDRNLRTDKNRQCITRYIKNWADATEIKGCSSLQTLYRFDSDVLRSAQLFIYRNRCASAKKKTPTMEILPDKKELIMKGGTFQEQLSAFQ